MSEITKLYDNANIAPKKCSECDNSMDCSFGKNCYIPFTAEKQLLLLQWLLDRVDLYLHRHKTDFTYSIASGDIAANKCKKFKESIAEFINTIWRDLTEEEKQQIKEILE